VAATGLEEKYDAVRQLIAIGKERGYLLYDEVNDSLPAEVHSSEEIDDLLTTFERNGIEIYEDQASAKAARAAGGRARALFSNSEISSVIASFYLRGGIPLFPKRDQRQTKSVEMARSEARRTTHYARHSCPSTEPGRGCPSFAFLS